MKVHRIAASLLCAVLLGTSLPAAAAPESVKFSHMPHEVNGGEPVRGVDVSSVLACEAAGVVFHDDAGNEADLFRVLADHGVNYIRVRVWNDPYDSQGHSYGGGNTDVKTAAEIGRRAAQYGMKLLVDFHYSDFWADPEKQRAPKAWSSMSHAEKGSAIYYYTIESLTTIREAGADIGMVQIGNETNGVFCGEDDMYKICEMFKAGCNAVRDFDPQILRVLHFANPSCGYYDWYAKVLHECEVNYDVFATSYYPYWHGTTDNMASVLRGIATKYNKYVMVAETAYPYTNEDGDTFGNAVSKDSSGVTFRYEISPEGQAECLTDVFRTVESLPGGIGVFYWEPAWLGKSGISWEEQKQLWDTKGSGWATGYAAEYDASVDGSGGSSYDNQALFDFQGYPLSSLDVFSRIEPRPYHYAQGDEATLADGIYTIRNRGSSLYMTADDKGNVIQDSGKALWHLRRTKDGNYTIVFQENGRYLTIREGSETQSSVGLSGEFLGKEALFTIVAHEEGYLLLTDASDRRQCVDVFDGSEYAGAWMIYNKPMKSGTQLFDLELVREDETDKPEIPSETMPPTMSPERLLKGDVLVDGSVDLTDLVLLQKHMLGLVPLDRTQTKAADMDNSGTVDVFDLGALKRLLLES